MDVAGGCLVLLIVFALLSLLYGWLLMLLWGILASIFGFQTIGYGTAVVLGLLLSALSTAFGTRNR